MMHSLKTKACQFFRNSVGFLQRTPGLLPILFCHAYQAAQKPKSEFNRMCLKGLGRSRLFV